KGAQGSGESSKIWFSKILTIPGGNGIIMTIGVVIFIIGIYQFYYAFSDGFDYRIDYDSSALVTEHIVRVLAKIGNSAWGIVYLMVGFLVFQAGLHGNPKQAGGLGKALSALQKQPYGQWVL